MANDLSGQGDDETLLLRVAVDRDKAAFTILVGRFAPRVTGYLTERFFRSIGEHLIEDAVNITFMKVWKYAEAFFRKSRTFESWIIAIAHNAALSLFKQKKKHSYVSLNDNPDIDPADPCEEEDPPDGVVKDREVRALDDFIEKDLTGLEQAVARRQLATGGHADYDKLADEFETNKNVVYVTWNKVKKKLELKIEGIRKQQASSKGKI
jgi:RNA polymerase sigma factor (sigma-70 family)